MPLLYPCFEARPLPHARITTEMLKRHESQLAALGVRLDEFETADDIVRCSTGSVIWQAARDGQLLDESPFIELLLEKASRIEALASRDGREITDALLECLADDALDEVRFFRLRPVA